MDRRGVAGIGGDGQGMDRQGKDWHGKGSIKLNTDSLSRYFD
jgi:hypothetical protein